MCISWMPPDSMGNHLRFLVVYFLWTVSYSDGLPDCCNRFSLEGAFRVTCSGCRLQAIPQDMPMNTTWLNLSRNKVKILLAESFTNVPRLEHLLLQYNRLSVISSGAFDHLRNLKYLDLSNNLLDASSFEATVFQSLNNLQNLIIHKNNFRLSKAYPETALLSVSQIETLSIDLFDGLNFGKGFLNLTNLKTLDFDEDGQLSISNTSFQGLAGMNIPYLRLFLRTATVENNALYPFHNMSSLYLDSRRYRDIRDMLPLLYGLRGRTMQSVTFKNNYLRNYGTVHLGESDIRFLSSICIRELYLSNNAIASISLAAVLSWTSRGCIESLDLSRNSVQSPQVFFILKLFPSIQHFDCSYKTSSFLRKRKSIMYQRVYLPHSLVYLNLAHFQFQERFGNLNFDDNNNLKVLDISDQQFKCDGHRMDGLSHITEFDISRIDCSKPHPEMFTDMPMLLNMKARECQFGNSFYTMTLFKGLNNLSIVDLSSNKIAQLNSSTFTDQSESLKSLLLADNVIRRFPVEALEPLNVLDMLDISKNLIPSLTYSECTLLDNYRSQSDKFTAKLAGNPLLCDCDNLDFLSWIDTTQVIADKDQLVCVNNNVKIVKFLETYHEFRVDCSSQSWLIVSIILAVICLVLGILFSVAWRYSVRLRMWCRQPVEYDTYPYDIFISYCREDCPWIRKIFAAWLEEHDIRYSAEDKTFDTGLDICDNIIGAIDGSHQSVFVVSCKFLEYEWQTFAMKVASRYSFREGREDMNIIILLNDMKRSEFPKLIRENWDKIRPLQWPNEHNTDETRLNIARKLFWDKLLKRIRKGNKRLAAASLNSESTV